MHQYIFFGNIISMEIFNLEVICRFSFGKLSHPYFLYYNIFSTGKQ